MPRINISLTDETFLIWEAIPDGERSAWVQAKLYEDDTIPKLVKDKGINEQDSDKELRSWDD